MQWHAAELFLFGCELRFGFVVVIGGGGGISRSALSRSTMQFTTFGGQAVQSNQFKVNTNTLYDTLRYISNTASLGDTE